MVKKSVENQVRNLFIVLIVILVVAFILMKFTVVPHFTQDENGESHPFLYVFGKQVNHYYYNNFEIRKIVDGYQSYHFESLIKLEKMLAIVNTRNGPLDVENISITSPVSEMILDAKKIYVTFEDTNASALSAVAALELIQFTDNPYLWDITTEPAYTTPYKNLTVTNCENSTATTLVILMHPSNTTRIFNSDKCIIIESSSEEDFVRAADRLGFTLIGVMKPSNQAGVA